jgi:alkanesulfonate monooxygenase SsuD/methylene tetrahydromethanopterin reductase-like flavin-dependent oxidoreductase (luciferase family)
MGVGVSFTPFETRAEVIMRLAIRADELGLDRVSIAEGWTHDSMILLAELALRTSRIDLGTGVVSVWKRTPATIALGAAGLQRCSGGRFSLGIGAGSPALAEGFHGIAWDRPLVRLRDTLVAVRTLLAGERLPSPVPGARASAPRGFASGTGVDRIGCAGLRLDPACRRGGAVSMGTIACG